MENVTWIDPNTQIGFSTLEILDKITTAHKDYANKYKIIVGTDSNATGKYKRYVFATVICIQKLGKGADYFYYRSYEPLSSFKGNHKMRLFQEVSKSIEVADFIKETIKVTVDEIHIDASEKGIGEFSSDFSDQLIGYAISSGYATAIKPFSFVATSASDKHTKR